MQNVIRMWGFPDKWFFWIMEACSFKDQDFIEDILFTEDYCCSGEGNGTPLRYSCLENPMDGRAWWAAVHGVVKSRTRLSDWLHFHFLLACIGKRNGNPLQRSCLENPRDGGAWWAAACGVAHSPTRLKWLSSCCSVTKSCLTLCDPIGCSMLGFCVLHCLLELAQTLWVSDVIQPSHPLSSPSPPAFNLFQHQGLPMSRFFTSGGQSLGASTSASVLPVNIQGWFPLGLTGLISLLSKGLSRVFSSTIV